MGEAKNSFICLIKTGGKMSSDGYGVVIAGEMSESDDEKDVGETASVMPVVVAGEGSESEEEEEEEDRAKELATALPVIVSGEGSESDDGEEEGKRSETTTFSPMPVVVAGECSESEDEDDIEDEIGEADDLLDDQDDDDALQGIIVCGEASESEGEEEEREEERDSALEETSTSPATSTGKKPHKIGYESVLHLKLAETNSSLNSSIASQWQKLFKTAAKDVSAISHSFQRTRQITQETSHTMRLLTNNLFRMEDSVDIVASCSLLPKIKL